MGADASASVPDVTHHLYRIRPTRPAMLAEGYTSFEESAIDAHFVYLLGLADEGVVVHAGRTLTEDDTTFGIVILAATDETEARRIIEADPAVARGVMRAEVFPYRVAIGQR